ncbi:DUF2752 domain-containing protein [Pedobacter sandarakinus]|uniref:DUF2752 domain-containing protein n=1 Tax=Pedobacter sandarakinus TaxID=353156 RepID=UPI00224715AB|nr:DUF2752 domain-containing protein [Pedobacter sandarakinus]MCX2576243.1 DUF2752 domain-containing protein [Pedobacter sandarakinus]
MGQQVNLLDWLSDHLLACPLKANFGIDCPGCGFQRSVISIFRGEFFTSVKLYPATFPLIFIGLFLLLHLKYNFNFGASLIKIMAILIAVIILINYIYKIYNHQLTA